MSSRSLKVLKAASVAARVLPLSISSPVVEAVASRVGPRVMPGKAAMLARHLQRVGDHAAGAGDRDQDRGRPIPAVGAGFGSYARYWVESFRLPSVGLRQLDRGFSFIGYEHIEGVRASGIGPVLVLPHLGGWEWAAAWLGRVAEVPVTAVVERLEPQDVFDWFKDLRSTWGVEVIPLGSDAFARTVRAVRDRRIVCLLADRDIGGTGVEVEFFGERTTLPLGPAVVASRTGAPILPTAVFFSGRQRICRVGAPIYVDDVDPTGGRSGADGARLRGRARHHALTQRMATEFERLIEQAPEQWHLLEPNWPTDHHQLEL